MKKKAIALLAILGVLACGFGCISKSDESAHSTIRLSHTTSVTSHALSSVEHTKDYYTSSEYKYYLIGNGIKLKRYLGEEIHVKIPSEIDNHKVKNIGADSFYQKIEMESVTIPASVTEIEGGAFYKCYSLEKVFIPKNVTKIDGNPYFKCSSLKEIEVDLKNNAYCDIDGVLYTKDKLLLVAYPEGRKTDIYFIPEGVKEISDEAFGYAADINKLYIPKSVTIFPKYFFVPVIKNITLIVEKGSAAEKYAVENKFTYEIKQ